MPITYTITSSNPSVFDTNSYSTATAISMFNILFWDNELTVEYHRFGTSRAKREIVCAWTDAFQLAYNLLLPGSETTGGFLGTVGLWAPPYGLASSPGLLAVDFNILGEAGITGKTNYTYTYTNGLTGQVCGYTYARCEIIYESPNFQSDDLGELEISTTVEVVRPPGSQPAFSFMSNDASNAMTLDPDDNPGIRLTVQQITFRQRYQTTLLAMAVNSAVAAPVNSQTLSFISGGQTFGPYQAGYLKYEGMDTRYSPGGTGQPSWRVEHHFKYRSEPWNCALNCTGTSATWQTLYYKNSTQTLYNTSDLNLVINSGTP